MHELHLWDCYVFKADGNTWMLGASLTVSLSTWPAILSNSNGSLSKIGCYNIPFGVFDRTTCNGHPSRIIEHLMYFKNSLRSATNIPLGVIRVLFKIMCNKDKHSYINTKCYKNVFIAIQLAHRHIKQRKLTFNH